MNRNPLSKRFKKYVRFQKYRFKGSFGQSGGSFGRCVRCGFVVSVVLHEFEYSPSPLKIDVTCQTNWRKNVKT